MQEDLVISSENAGYVARVSCAFEEAGLIHRLDVDAGMLRIVVPSVQREIASRVLREQDMENALEPPGPGFSHLQHLDDEELEACIEEPRGFSSEEIIAAMQIRQMRDQERLKVIHQCCRMASMDEACVPEKVLDPGERFGLAVAAILMPPFALLFLLFVRLDRKPASGPSVEAIPSYCCSSRKFASIALIPSSAGTLFLVWVLFVST